MAQRLDPSATGASVTLGVRFDAAALLVIDAEAKRLESLTGEPCDRSRALRSIVRRYGASSTPAATPPPEKTPTPTTKSSTRSTAPKDRPSTPTAGRHGDVPADDRARVARDLKTQVEALGGGRTAMEKAAKLTGIHHATLYKIIGALDTSEAPTIGEANYTKLRAWLDKRAAKG